MKVKDFLLALHTSEDKKIRFYSDDSIIILHTLLVKNIYQFLIEKNYLRKYTIESICIDNDGNIDLMLRG